MVLNGLGFVNQQLSLVPRFFQNKPLSRLITPGITSEHCHDDALGQALETLYAYRVTELYRLIAAAAAERLGLAPTVAHLDRTSFHGDGRYNSDEAPEAQVIPMIRGYSRDHRPDLPQMMLELIVEHQAGIPLLMNPSSAPAVMSKRAARSSSSIVSSYTSPTAPPLWWPEVKAFKQLCGTALACEADAQQALSTFEQGLQATVLAKCTVRPTPRDGQRGRPGQGAPPAHMVYYLEGALASRSRSKR